MRRVLRSRRRRRVLVVVCHPVAESLVAAAAGRAMILREITGQPVDHPELVTVPETGYLKGALLEALD